MKRHFRIESDGGPTAKVAYVDENGSETDLSSVIVSASWQLRDVDENGSETDLSSVIVSASWQLRAGERPTCTFVTSEAAISALMPTTGRIFDTAEWSER